MNLPLYIAGRYLFAKKSHNVINVISAISVSGMAIGTAVLIVILSVYNGFDGIVKDALGDMEPDLAVTPVEGKVFAPDAGIVDEIARIDGVRSVCMYLEDNVFVDYDGVQAVAAARGVDEIYAHVTAMPSHVLAGEFLLRRGDAPMCAVGSGLARRLGLNPSFVASLNMYYPERTGTISLANPASSLHHIKLRPSCTFSVNATTDESLVIIPIESMRQLTGYGPEQCSGLEIRLLPGCGKSGLRAVERRVSELLGSGCRVADRERQNAALYRMMRYEKAAIFLILIFVVIIIGFNIYGSLSMLIIEKRGDIGTLRSMGATEGMIRRVFVLEGWLISLLGIAAGTVAGLAFVLLQQRFGFVRMPGNYLITAYPVILKWSDVLLTAAGTAATGWIIARLPVREIRKHSLNT